MEYFTYEEKFAKHVPGLLRKQLIADCLNYLLDERKSVNAVYPRPSIQRLHGALLFVDISGFTILSQKLDVDRLRSFINAYFKMLIDIVYKYDGEVIKFAGDALFIVWQTRVTELDAPNYKASAKEAVLKATTCALEVIESCSHYKVEVQGEEKGYINRILEAFSPVTLSRLTRVPLSPIAGNVGSPGRSPTVVDGNKNISYLDVHCGIAVGTMAALDVGFDNRWEYLLLGKPLSDVAEAEGEANKGEVVLCQAAHEILHGNDVQCSSSSSSSSCGCTVTAHGLYNIFDKEKISLAGPHSMTIHHRVSRFHFETVDDMKEYGIGLHSEIAKEIGHAYNHVRPQIEALLSSASLVSGSNALLEDEGALFNARELLYSDSVDRLNDCLLDGIAKHTHAVARSNYVCKDRNYQGYLLEKVAAYQLSSTLLDSSKFGMAQTKAAAPRNRNMQRGFSYRVNEDTAANATNGSLHNQDQEEMMLSELREVIVLFINVSLVNADIFSTSSHRDHIHQPKVQHQGKVADDLYEPGRAFHFLSKTAKEQEDDAAILKQFQDCFQVIVQEFHRDGGQVRQFIVDDKGTVAIGTFGLRGSVNSDNAATAVATANRVLRALKQQKIAASIGITCGKVYCGLVGSPYRHEYAVMGPSVNLAARLMGKAEPGSVLCDSEVRSKDQRHKFMPFAEIQAKGYAQPVPTFKPVFDLIEDSFTFRQQLNCSRQDLASAAKAVNDLGMDRRSVVQPEQHLQSANYYDVHEKMVGRDEEMKTIVEFMRCHGLYKGVEGTGLFDGEQKIEEADILTELMASDLQSSASIASSPSAHQQQVLQNSSIFDWKAPSLLVITSGATGMGKTLFNREICERLAKFQKVYAAWNIEIYHAENTKARKMEPFSSWKTLLINLLADFASTVKQTGEKSPHKHRNKLQTFQTTEAAAVLGLDILVEKLSVKDRQGRVFMPIINPEEEGAINRLLSPRLLSPRLLSPRLLSPRNDQKEKEEDNAIKLQEVDNMAVLAGFLALVLSKYTELTGRVLVLNMGELAYFDDQSATLLDLVLRRCSGILVLTTSYQQQVEDNPHLLQYLISDRCLHLPLSTLEPEKMFDLVQQLLISQGVPPPSESIVTKVCEISNGNPSYAIDLAKVVSHYVVHHAEAVHYEDSIELQNLLTTFHISRLEEVVCFRFDHLSEACQQVLKAVAIACANGQNASYSLIATMMFSQVLGGGGFSSGAIFSPFLSHQEMMVRIDDILREVLDSGEFVVVRGENKGGMLDSSLLVSVRSDQIEKEMSLLVPSSPILSLSRKKRDSLYGVLNNYSSESSDDPFIARVKYVGFRQELEHQVIYELMLDDQRAVLHEKVAVYLANEAAKSMHSNAEDIFELGFHWEMAGKWSKALTCYAKSGLALYHHGSYLESRAHLSLAYKMIHQLKIHAGIVNDEDDDGDEDDIEDKEMEDNEEASKPKSLISRLRRQRSDSNSLINQSVGSKSYKDLKLTKKADIYRMCGGDQSLLDICIKVLHHLGELCSLTTTNKEQTNCANSYIDPAKFYEEAFLLISTVANADKLQRKRNSKPDSVSNKNQGHGLTVITGSVYTSSSDELMGQQALLEEQFTFKDPTICFPVLSDIFKLSSKTAITSSADVKKMQHNSRQAKIIQLFLYIVRSSQQKLASRDIGENADNNVYQLHEMVGLTYQSILSRDQGLIEESMSLMDEVMAMYSRDGYHQLSSSAIEEHHLDLIRIYKCDMIPSAIATTMQLAFLRGHFHRVDRYSHWLETMILPEFLSARQVSNSKQEQDMMADFKAVAISLMIVYVEMRRYDDAYHLCNKLIEGNQPSLSSNVAYPEKEKYSHHDKTAATSVANAADNFETASLERKYMLLLVAWIELQQLSNAVSSKGQEMRREESTLHPALTSALMRAICAKEFLIIDNQSNPFKSEIAYACAAILFNEAQQLWLKSSSDDLQKNAEQVLEYVDLAFLYAEGNMASIDDSNVGTMHKQPSVDNGDSFGCFDFVVYKTMMLQAEHHHLRYEVMSTEMENEQQNSTLMMKQEKMLALQRCQTTLYSTRHLFAEPKCYYYVIRKTIQQAKQMNLDLALLDGNEEKGGDGKMMDDHALLSNQRLSTTEVSYEEDIWNKLIAANDQPLTGSSNRALSALRLSPSSTASLSSSPATNNHGSSSPHHKTLFKNSASSFHEKYADRYFLR